MDIDRDAHGERGQVNPKGTIKDRRHSPPWTWVLVGSLIVQFMLMTVAIAVGAIITRNIQTATDRAAVAAHKAQIAAERLDGAVAGSCERTQTERERSNVAEATIYLVLKAAADSPTTDPVAAREFREQSAATSWSPPANCDRAVQSPKTYRQPPPISFSRLPAGYPRRIVTAAKRGQRQPLP